MVFLWGNPFAPLSLSFLICTWQHLMAFKAVFSSKGFFSPGVMFPKLYFLL